MCLGTTYPESADWLAEVAEVAHLDLLLEEVYCHLGCLLKSASNCCKGLWTC
jgi:hypothetical protein